MEVPAEADGVVQDVKVKVGDKVSKGAPILMLGVEGDGAQKPAQATPQAEAPKTEAPKTEAPKTEAAPAAEAPAAEAPSGDGAVHASPVVRRLARERGVDLRRVTGTGPSGRVTQEDVQSFLRGSASGGAAFGGLPAWPKVDFAQYGEIERKPLSRIKRLSGPNLHRNWVSIPHITNYDEADVTSIEALRNDVNAEQAKSAGPKLTMLAFLVRACVAALQRFPEFNASLDGEELVYKRYYNIGFAADTPGGLIVPVIKNADVKGLIEIAREAQELAGKAREGKLTLAQMQGGSVHDLVDRRHRRHRIHADRQRAGGGDPRGDPRRHEAHLGRQAVRSAPDAAHQRELRPSGHRRSWSRALPGLRRGAARRLQTRHALRLLYMTADVMYGTVCSLHD